MCCFLYYERMRFLKLNFGWLERGIRGGSSIISPSSRHRVYRSLLRHIIVPHLFREINADATTAHQLLPILVAIPLWSLPAEDRIEASLSRLFIHHLCACLCFSFLNCLFATACVFYPELYKDCMSVFTEESFFFSLKKINFSYYSDIVQKPIKIKIKKKSMRMALICFCTLDKVAP